MYKNNRLSSYAFTAILIILFFIGLDGYAQNNKPTIAVLNFQSNTGNSSIDAMLSEGTAETIITDLSNIREIEVVERSRLVDINHEIAYSYSGMVDEATAQKAGRQVGAQYIVVGHWQKFGGQYRVNARIVEVETALVIASVKETGGELAVFDLQDNLVEEILGKLDISISSDTRAEIHRRETNSLSAYKEYSQGLRELDKGNTTNMKKHMTKALEYDPNYVKPKKYVYTLYDKKGSTFGSGSSLAAARWKTIGMFTLVTGGISFFMPELDKNIDSDERMKYTTLGAAMGFVVGVIYAFTLKVKKEEISQSDGQLDRYTSIDDKTKTRLFIDFNNSKTPIIRISLSF